MCAGEGSAVETTAPATFQSAVAFLAAGEVDEVATESFGERLEPSEPPFPEAVQIMPVVSAPASSRSVRRRGLASSKSTAQTDALVDEDEHNKIRGCWS